MFENIKLILLEILVSWRIWAQFEILLRSLEEAHMRFLGYSFYANNLKSMKCQKSLFALIVFVVFLHCFFCFCLFVAPPTFQFFQPPTLQFFYFISNSFLNTIPLMHFFPSTVYRTTNAKTIWCCTSRSCTKPLWNANMTYHTVYDALSLQCNIRSCPRAIHSSPRLMGLWQPCRPPLFPWQLPPRLL